MTKAFEINGDTLTVNVGAAILDEEFKSDLETAIGKHNAQTANSIYEMNGAVFNMEYTNVPKSISPSAMPDSMTGAELKENNQKAKLASKMIDYIDNLRITYPNDSDIKVAIQRLHPELTDADISSIFSFVSDEHRYDSEYAQHVASATAFAVAIKNGKKLFS